MPISPTNTSGLSRYTKAKLVLAGLIAVSVAAAPLASAASSAGPAKRKGHHCHHVHGHHKKQCHNRHQHHHHAHGHHQPPPPPPPPFVDGLKEPVKGVQSMGGPAPTSYLPVVNNAVIRVSWKELQAQPYGPIAADNQIDRTLNKVRALNAANPNLRMGIKLRFDSGTSAPDWVKNLGGAPPYSHSPNASGTVPRFWTTAVQQAYADVYGKLAAKYDTAPELLEVTNSLCATLFTEPTVRWNTDAKPFYAAGFTIAADQACQRQSFVYGLLWKHTRIATSISAFHFLYPTGVKTDEKYSEFLADECRQILGQQCVLENNELGKRRGSAKQYAMYDALYAHFKALGGPISFQMAAPKNGFTGTQAGYLETLHKGVALGAGSVELYPTYKSIPVGLLAPHDAALAAQ